VLANSSPPAAELTFESTVRHGNRYYARSYGIAGGYYTIYGEVAQTLPDRVEGRLPSSTISSRCNVNSDLENPVTEAVLNDSRRWSCDAWLGIGRNMKANDFKDLSGRIKSAHLPVLGDPPAHFSLVKPTKVKNQEEEKEESAIHDVQSSHHQ
jgi:hypothetical protein